MLLLNAMEAESVQPSRKILVQQWCKAIQLGDFLGVLPTILLPNGSGLHMVEEQDNKIYFHLAEMWNDLGMKNCTSCLTVDAGVSFHTRARTKQAVLIHRNGRILI